MKAIACRQWGLPDTLSVQEFPNQQPCPGQVGIGVPAAGVNFPDVLPSREVTIQATITVHAGRRISAPVQARMPMQPGLDFATATTTSLIQGTSHHAVTGRTAPNVGEIMPIFGAN